MHLSLLAIAALLGIGGGTSTSGQDTGAAASIYGTPQQTAQLPSGRRLNYLCLGEGSPTVVLTAGFNDTTLDWEPVHATMALTTRVCAWDRAGFGFSDASPEPQNAENTTADLEALLILGAITGPFIMVGHSAGGHETVIFTHRRPQDVAGIVLVDAAHPGQEAAWVEAAPRASADANADFEADDSEALACLARIRASGRRERCLGRPADEIRGIEAGFADVLVQRWSDPDLIATQISLSTEWSKSAQQAAAALGDWGDRPLIVLSAASVGLPAEFSDEEAALSAAKQVLARDYAGRSTRGRYVLVTDSGHYIQDDRPEVVVVSVNEVVEAVRARAASGPMTPSDD
jgi:pimeloyl-ACP methyl ester carboxylesterase